MRNHSRFRFIAASPEPLHLGPNEIIARERHGVARPNNRLRLRAYKQKYKEVSREPPLTRKWGEISQLGIWKSSYIYWCQRWLLRGWEERVAFQRQWMCARDYDVLFSLPISFRDWNIVGEDYEKYIELIFETLITIHKESFDFLLAPFSRIRICKSRYTGVQPRALLKFPIF